MTNKNTELPADGSRGRRRRVCELLVNIEEKIENAEVKPTISDYIRVIQLERELDEDEAPKEVRVSWIDQRERFAIER